MKRLLLTRFAYSDQGTFGQFEVGDRTLYTVERPWRDNAPRVSCIPEGIYRCEPRMFYRGGYPAIEIKNVPGRDSILFHRGNTSLDVVGCIAVGSELGCLNGRWAVLGSGRAWDNTFFPAFGSEVFELEIVGFMPEGVSEWDR